MRQSSRWARHEPSAHRTGEAKAKRGQLVREDEHELSSIKRIVLVGHVMIWGHSNCDTAHSPPRHLKKPGDQEGMASSRQRSGDATKVRSEQTMGALGGQVMPVGQKDRSTTQMPSGQIRGAELGQERAGPQRSRLTWHSPPQNIGREGGTRATMGSPGREQRTSYRDSKGNWTGTRTTTRSRKARGLGHKRLTIPCMTRWHWQGRWASFGDAAGSELRTQAPLVYWYRPGAHRPEDWGNPMCF